MKERWLPYALVALVLAWCFGLTVQLHKLRQENLTLRKSHQIHEEYMGRWGGHLARVVRCLREAEEAGEPVRLPPDLNCPEATPVRLTAPLGQVASGPAVGM